MTRPNSTPENEPTIRILQAATICFARIYHRIDVIRPCSIPKTGAAILVSNHTSGLDPALIQAVCPRLITWMMAREYYHQPGMRWLFKRIGVIPVDRNDRDVAAMRLALRTLHEGGVLGIFPEGRIETSRELLPFQTGAALMALKTGVPIYPCYLDGSQRNRSMLQAVLLPQHANITFGEPLHLKDGHAGHGSAESAARVMQAAIYALYFDKNKNKITKDGKK
jgi:1-acyl-sn-glycerol-3-phosphate acyltransferase